MVDILFKIILFQHYEKIKNFYQETGYLKEILQPFIFEENKNKTIFPNLLT